MILTVTLNPAVDKLYRVDALEPHQVMRVRAVNCTAGGKGLNVSRVAALLGAEVTAMGFVGGHNGAFFESLIDRTALPGLCPAFTAVSGETRSCINIYDAATSASTELLEPGQPVTPAETERFLADFKARLPAADLVSISGSLPAGLPTDFYARLVEMARRAGKPVLVDTSGNTLKATLPARPDFIKPNTDELRQITAGAISGPAQVMAAARKLHESGIGRVAVSLGAEGVLVASNEGMYRGKPPKITPVNTVGCGDSMVAGFAVGLARGLSPEDTIRQAVAVSAANALTGDTGFFSRKDYEALLPQVEITRL